MGAKFTLDLVRVPAIMKKSIENTEFQNWDFGLGNSFKMNLVELVKNNYGDP